MVRSSVSRRVFSGAGCATAALAMFPCRSLAQSWPSQPIRIICGYPAGGLTDIFARAYSEILAKELGQPFVIDNKPGAGGSVAARLLKAAAPDGHSLMFVNTSTLATNHLLYKSVGYDAGHDFSLIAYLPVGHLTMVVHKSTGVETLEEFSRFARAHDVNVGTFGAGTFAHILVAELNRHFGLRMQTVHYRGEAPMWQDLAAGVVHAALGSYRAGVGVLEAKLGRAIAVTRSRRMKKLPDVPTFAEQGAAARAFELEGYVAMLGPAGLPPEIVRRLSDLMVSAGKSPRMQGLIDGFGIDEAARGHEDFRKIFAAPVWINLVQQLGLVPE
jgi:tripartite-type tricarboxylate transporter receptor subunit TctC